MSEAKTYQTTKEQCASMFKPNTCCRGCGGDLSPIETVDNAERPTFWLHCPICMSFESGVDKEIFRIAKEMVVTHGYVEYSGDRETRESDFSYWRQIQIRGTCSTVRTVLEIKKKLSAKGVTEEMQEVHAMD